MPVKQEDSWNLPYLIDHPLHFDDELGDGIELLDFPQQELIGDTNFLKSSNDVISLLSTSPTTLFTNLSTQQPDTNPFQINISEIKPFKDQIRNHDCMWSGRCSAHQEKSKCSNKSASNINKSTINNNNMKNNIKVNGCNSKMNCDSSVKPSLLTNRQIPAGHSLLLNSKYNQTQNCTNNNNRLQNCNSQITSTPMTIANLPTISTNDFLKARETTHQICTVRPDTPISMDDDAPEFKHTLDLTACTMGSNRMSLVKPEDVQMITLIKDHLEDTSNDRNIHNQRELKFMQSSKPVSLDDLWQDLKEISDYQIEDDEEESNDSNGESSDSESGFSSGGSISNTSPPISDISDEGGQLITPLTSKFEYPATHVDDHCYTRSKNRVDTDPLGVQTPSDSEEEIDVVSVGDKTLPTNPTARDRRALQTTVADRISARMVKTPRGIKTLPPRRQYSYDDSLVSSCSSTPTKSSNSSYSMQWGDLTTSNHSLTTSGSTRKRQHSSKDSNSSSSKRHRGKKQRSPNKRQTSDTDEADTIEKRNLHNDMERQRRIGLKNLFEELKRQIPSIRDKERAPKVSILREAATLCTKLNREQEQLNALKKQQHRLMQRVKSLRTSLASQWG